MYDTGEHMNLIYCLIDVPCFKTFISQSCYISTKWSQRISKQIILTESCTVLINM